MTATPNTGYEFKKWDDGVEDNPRTVTVTVTANADYTAIFEAKPIDPPTPPVQKDTTYIITVQANNGTWGTASGSGTYKKDTTIEIKAVANSGYKFVEWQEDHNTNAVRSVKVEADATYTAVFEQEQTPSLITINGSTFPDSTFLAYILDAIDTDHDGQLSEDEINAVTVIIIKGNGTKAGGDEVEDLTGLEIFTRLEYLDCSNTQVKRLDVSQNLALKTLLCYNTRLTSLDLSKNANLERLEAQNCRLLVELENNTFNLGLLPGFKVANASNWQGGQLAGTVLTFTEETVNYEYATGYTGTHNIPQTVVFRLEATNYVGEPTANEYNGNLFAARAYPNPSMGLFAVEVGCGAVAELYAATGLVLGRYEWNTAGRYAVDLRGRVAGVYYLRLMADGAVRTVKLVVR